jgi:hypothetical protein
MSLVCVITYFLIILLALALVAAAGRDDRARRAFMKKCGVCGKDVREGDALEPRLMMGPRGYRQYDCCLSCWRKSEGLPAKPEKKECSKQRS